MNNKKKYITRIDRMVSLSLEKKETKAWGKFPSQRKGRSSLPKNINTGNGDDKRKKASVERIIAGLSDNYNYKENDLDDDIPNNDGIVYELSEVNDLDDDIPINDEIMDVNEDTPDVRYEYLNNGVAIGMVKICTESKPGLIVHGKPLSDMELKVKVLEKYDVEDDGIEVFHPGTYLALSKVKLRKVATTKVGAKRRRRGWKIGASPRKWSSKKRELFRDSGKSYENDKGVLVSEKRLKERPCKSCKFTDCRKVVEIERKEIFDNFYNSGIVITQNVKVIAKKTTKLAKEGVMSKPKGVSRKYLINGKTVCKELFPATYSITMGRLERLMKKVQSNPNTVPKDRRGKHGNQKTINEDVYQTLGEMIERLPKYISHYSREKHTDNILYLQSGTVLASKGKK